MDHREEPELCLQGLGEPQKGLGQGGEQFSLAVCGGWMGEDGTDIGDQEGGRGGPGRREGAGSMGRKKSVL